MMRLSIIVISRNLENCRALFRSLERSHIQIQYEILVSWNGAPEDVLTLGKLSPTPTRVFQSAPYHFAKNNNAAALSANGDILGFINDDVLVDEGAVAAAVSCFDNKAVGIVGGRLRYGDGRLQHAGVYFKDDLTPFHLDKLSDQTDSAQHRTSKFVPAVTGAFLFIRRREFLELRFDERYDVAGEDIDLCLRYRRQFDAEIYYCAEASAIHYENITRKQTGQKTTPARSLERLRRVASERLGPTTLAVPRPLKIAIKTEKPGWILHRQAEEIRKHLRYCDVPINQPIANCDVAYYINYGYFERRYGAEIVVANFTHFDPQNLADKFRSVAHACDHCIAVSNRTRRELLEVGVPAEKISVIENGADAPFAPRAVLGVVGRVYPGGRKGEDLVAALAADPEVMEVARIVAASEGWGLPVWRFDDARDFYLAIDLLLIPSRREGGPVPFFEALASGKAAIAPKIGAIPDYPHISYECGDFASLRASVLAASREIVSRRQTYSRLVKDKNWVRWAHEHELVFRNIVTRIGVRSHTAAGVGSMPTS